jgi:Flp pilus assembly pilin Flp
MRDITSESEKTASIREENTATNAGNVPTTVPAADERKEKGASMVEYALVVGLIAVLCIIAIRVLGQAVSSQFSNVGYQLG